MNFKKSLNRIISATLAGTLALTMVSFPQFNVKAASDELLPEIDEDTQKIFIIKDAESFKTFTKEWSEWKNPPAPDTDNSDIQKEDGKNQNEKGSDPEDKSSSSGYESGTPGDNTQQTDSTKSEGDGKKASDANKNPKTNKSEDKNKVQIADNVTNAVGAPDTAITPEPVGVLANDIELTDKSTCAEFAGTIYGNGHIIYTPTTIFGKLTGKATLINIQFTTKSIEGMDNVKCLVANEVESATLINCFSSIDKLPMFSGKPKDNPQFHAYNCYTKYSANAVDGKDNAGIKILPEAKMKTMAFAYIMNHPNSKELPPEWSADKIGMMFMYKPNTYPVAIQRLPDSPVKQPTEEPLDSNGSEYLIRNSSDLLSLSMLTELGMLPDMDGGKPMFAQTENIKMDDRANRGFEPIGTEEYPFTATYDGFGHVIKGLESAGGLFNRTSNAKIVNLAIEDAKITENTATYKDAPENKIYTGILINYSEYTTIDRCYVTGEISGQYVGGMIGSANFLTLSNCYSRAKIDKKASERSGGLIGYDFNGDYKNLYVSDPYTKEDKTGGLFGYILAPSSLVNCYYNKGSNNGEELNFTIQMDPSKFDVDNPIPKLTGEMQTHSFSEDLNSDPLDEAFGWDGSRNDRFPVLYGIGIGIGVEPPQACTVTLEQPEGAVITITYGGKEYKEDGDEINLVAGSEILITCEDEYTYEFDHYVIEVEDKATKKIKQRDVAYTIIGNTVITAEIDKNGVTVDFSYDDGGYVEYDSLISGQPELGVSGDSITLEKGAQFEFNIFTEYGYKIKKVTYTAGTIQKISENKYRIKRVSKDGTVNIEFENNDEVELKEVVDDKTGDVVVKVNKQTDIIDQIPHNSGNKIQTVMDKATMLSGKVLNELYGQDVGIQLVMDDYRWDIDGKTLTRTRNRNINMGVNLGENKATLSEIATKQLENHENVIPLNLVHRGNFPFTGYLTLNVGEEQQYRYASLFYYNPKSKVFEFQECNDVAENGDLTYRFTHASDYVIVIENEPIWDLAAGEGMAETEMPIL